MDEDELLKAIQRLPNKQCAFDPIPTWLLKKMSAAFDLVDHSILLKRLESTYGFDGLTLEWFKNYLTDSSFNVRCSGTKSEFVDSSVFVPQGSVFGPLLFFLYTGDLEKIVLKYKLVFHQSADDTQIYGHFDNEGTEELQIRVSECVDEIASWMGALLSQAQQ